MAKWFWNLFLEFTLSWEFELDAQKQKIEEKKKWANGETIVICGVIEHQGSYWFQQGHGFGLCCASKSCHLLISKIEDEIYFSTLSRSFTLAYLSLKSLSLPTASSSRDKKKGWSQSGISCNSLWISKWFVKMDVQIITVFQTALGTHSCLANLILSNKDTALCFQCYGKMWF